MSLLCSKPCKGIHFSEKKQRSQEWLVSPLAVGSPFMTLPSLLPPPFCWRPHCPSNTPGTILLGAFPLPFLVLEILPPDIRLAQPPHFLPSLWSTVTSMSLALTTPFYPETCLSTFIFPVLVALFLVVIALEPSSILEILFVTFNTFCLPLPAGR